MADDLQSLLDRIRKEGVDKAHADAGEIINQARQRAAEILAAAETAAAARVAQAEADSKLFVERAQKTLNQAARDLIIEVGDAISRTLGELVRRRVESVLSLDVLKEMLLEIVRAYCRGGDSSCEIGLLVSPQQHKEILEYFLNELRNAVQQGLEIHADKQLTRGFRVSISDGDVYHDFSSEAIAEALCQLLRPELARIVSAAIPKEKA